MNDEEQVVNLALKGLLRWLGFTAKVLLPVGLFAVSIVAATANRGHAAAIDPNVWPATTLSLRLVNTLNVNPALARARDARGQIVGAAPSTPSRNPEEQRS